ncbi:MULTISPECIES: hypothetical protein [unclassified Oceanobacter]|uniref:hypothetical protein n=1 Tax=unclassified Oceanobacter TaxID=2620260 RepID=UPI002736CB26|nr:MULTISPECIES: hypothetical protein [unclassified Oceanobacter]MDP2505127.1 hypothetical protein [Oceanobacter sp. 3_MG-2023]MDP2548251.1 hypothetical protein [Oceanobacter sp. 4_MG-2023]
MAALITLSSSAGWMLPLVPVQAEPEGAPKRESDSTPDIGLLLYLADQVEIDDEWIDPMMLLGASPLTPQDTEVSSPASVPQASVGFPDTTEPTGTRSEVDNEE